MHKVVVSVVTAVVIGAGAAVFVKNPTPREKPPTTPVMVAAAPAPEAAPDSAFVALTARWTNEQRVACAAALRDVLGTRALVQGALAGVSDPGNRAADEIADARHWLEQGDESLESQRAALLRGECSGEVATGLEQATQHYIKAGTSAVQAARIAGS